MTDLHHRPPSAPARRPLRRVLAQSLCLVLALGQAAPVLAQFNRNDAPMSAPRIPGARNLSTELKLEGKRVTSDYIVAVVNQEVITHTDVDKRVARIEDSVPDRRRLPDPATLRRQVLEALIDEKAQVSHARTIGLSISDGEVDLAIENIAAQNQLTLAELRQRMQTDGLDFERYRSSLREQILLQRLREREVMPRIQISEAEIDTFLREDPSAQAESNLNLAHILIAVPSGSTELEVRQLKQRADDIRERAARGVNFTQLVRENSDDRDTHDSGGAFGMRPASNLPELFVTATRGLRVGEVSQVVRSNAGFHVIKLVERENVAQARYTQQRARHILLRTTPKVGAEELVRKMKGIRKGIIDGQASFAQMARQHSEDGSGARGGDLGWSSPGQYVPEFEKVLITLQPGEISQPVVSRFGVHLIQLIERREVQLSDAQRREAARSVLKERGFEAAYEEWARELRQAAWVEMRDEP
jgi:peptidyl-prolyl cis-trans isomerase SurA